MGGGVLLGILFWLGGGGRSCLKVLTEVSDPPYSQYKYHLKLYSVAYY